MGKRQKDISSRWVGAALACIVMAGVFVSCEKDEPIVLADPAIPEETPCKFEFPNNNGQLPPSIVDSMYFNRGLVNPNNPDEIVFLNKRDSKLYKLNYITGEKIVVLEDAMSFKWADWGTNDWILYTYFQNLYKVKSNGDSLTQITFNGVGWNANWNLDGTKYLYTTILPSGQAATVIANSEDAIIDTLPIGLNIDTDWVTDDTIFFNASMYIIGDPAPIEFMPIFPGGGNVAAVNTSEFILLGQGLRKVNVLSGQVDLLRESFPSCMKYLEIHYSPQKEKLLASRLYQRVMPDGRTVYSKGEIVWLNLDGTLHEVIDIAQFMNGE